MGTIQIKPVGRKTRDVTPKLTARAPESLATPFKEGGAKLGRAIQQTGKALQESAKVLSEKIDAHKEDKTRELVNDTYFDTFDQIELRFQEMKARKDIAGDDLVSEFNGEYEKLLGEAEVRLGGDKDAIAKLRTMAQSDRKRWGRELAIKTVSDREVAKATKDSSMLDKNVKTLMVSPTPTTLQSARAQMREEITETGYEENKAKQLIALADQKLVETYLGNLGPEQALAELDNRKLGYGQLFKDTEAKDNFKKTLQTKADSQKKRVEQEKQKEIQRLSADTLNKMVKGEEVDPFLIYDNPAVKNDPKAIAGFQKLFNNYSKTIKKDTQERQYTETMNDPNLVSMTDDDIFNKVTDVDDAKTVIEWRDNVLKNPSVNGQEYDEVKKFLKKDWEANKFGGKDTPEAKIEYARQLRSYQEWALVNPEKNPVDYYKQVMEPVNISLYDRAVSAAIPFFTDPRLERGAGPAQRRESIALDTQATKILKDNNKPVTPGNIAAVRAHLEAQSAE